MWTKNMRKKKTGGCKRGYLNISIEVTNFNKRLKESDGTNI